MGVGLMREGEDALAQAEQLLNDHQYHAIVDLLSPWVEGHPDDARAWELLAAAHLQRQAWPHAEQAAAQVVRLTPHSARAWSNWGTTLRKVDRLDQARNAQRKALQLEPGYERALTELGKMDSPRDRTGPDYSDAPKCPKCGARVQPTDHTCMGCGAHVLRAQPTDRQPTEHVETPPPAGVKCPNCGTVLLADQGPCTGCVQKAVACTNAGNPDRAIEILEKLRAAWPNSATIFNAEGQACEAKRDGERALMFYQAAYIADPQSAEAEANVARLTGTASSAAVAAQISTGDWVGYAGLGLVGGLVAVIGGIIWAIATTDARKRRLAWWTSAWGAAWIVAVIVGWPLMATDFFSLGGGAGGTGGPAAVSPLAVPAQDGVTLAQYSRLRTGMTEQEAFAILGPGTEISRSDVMGVTTVMYEWQGRGMLGANMNAMFQNGQLVQKAQFGLE